MSEKTFLAFAQLSEMTGCWHVKCLRCLAYIGTMSSEILREAVFRTADRQGIMCPECRSKSCLDCGNPFDNFPPIPNNRLCAICEWDREEEKHQIVCAHGVEQKMGDPQEEFGNCPLCEIEGAAQQVREGGQRCLSSISYLKPEEERQSSKHETNEGWLVPPECSLEEYLELVKRGETGEDSGSRETMEEDYYRLAENVYLPPGGLAELWDAEQEGQDAKGC